MKATLEFDIENPDYSIRGREQEKLKCAQKAWEMSGFIDSFLDYLTVVAPHISMDKLLDDLTSMYYNKLEEYDVIDILEDDTKDLVKSWCWDFYVEDEAEALLVKIRADYLNKKLEKEIQEDELKKLTLKK